MSVQHTALPWSAYWIDDARVCVRGAGGKFIAFVDGSTLATVHQRIADAKFIVRACNAHDELVAALELVEQSASHDQDCAMREHSANECTCFRAAVSAAIAQARRQV